jgi:hypothetical protein
MSMEEARVVIDLKEGIIELQGPVDFVRYYLEKYQRSMKGLQVSPGRAVAGLEKTARSTRGRPKKSARGKRVSCTAAIRNEIKTGFFDGPRSTGDVKQRLKEASFEFNDGNVRNSLKRLVASGALSADGKGGSLTYMKPGL